MTLPLIDTRNTNIFIGLNAGPLNTGTNNIFVGTGAGSSNYSGNYNTFMGTDAGYSITGGDYNVFVGRQAGYSNVFSDGNTFIGRSVGYSNVNGNYNTFLGESAGRTNTGSSSVFLGYHAGFTEANSNKLYITNTSSAPPLIGGDFSLGTPVGVGFAGIGTANPNSTFQIVGSFSVPVIPTNIDLALDDTHYTILATGGAGGITITLPTAVGITGRTYKIMKIDAGVGAITIDGAGAETINGAATKTVTVQYTAALIQSDGANWIGNLLALI